MADDKYKAMLAGIEVLIADRGVGEKHTWALVKHEFPLRDGAQVENRGKKGRPLEFTCFFYNADYDKHADLLAAVDKQGDAGITFVHPEHGIINGFVEQLGKRFDERELMCEIDITFIESLIEAGEEAVADTIPSSVEEAFVNGQTDAADEFAADTADALGTASGDIIDTPLETGTGIMETFSALSGKARAFVSQVDSAVRTLEGTLSQLTQVSNSIISTIAYAENLPGRIANSVASTVERVAEAYDTLRNFPQQFTSSLSSALRTLEDSFSAFESKAPAGSYQAEGESAAMTAIAKQINIQASHRLALEASYAFKLDQQARQRARANETKKSFDDLGNYLSPPKAETIMNVTEIEAMLAVIMRAAQRSVDAARGRTSIKASTAAITQHVQKIKLEIDRIYEYHIDGTVPIHLLCMMVGLPYSAAERILAINPQLTHPNFCTGTVKVFSA